MPDYTLPEHLEAVRNSLSKNDLRRLCQETIDTYATLAYKEGLKDGRERLLHAQRDEREKRPRRRGQRVEWLTAVYFIKAPRAIKIGMSYCPEKRLRALQTSHPEPLELVAICEGGQELEREYHQRFAAYRLSGEWFEPHPDILAEIDRLAHPSPPKGLS